MKKIKLTLLCLALLSITDCASKNKSEGKVEPQTTGPETSPKLGDPAPSPISDEINAAIKKNDIAKVQEYINTLGVNYIINKELNRTMLHNAALCCLL